MDPHNDDKQPPEEFFIEGSGVTVRVGTYVVQFDGDVAVSITATGPGSVKTPMGTQTRTGTEKYQLAPLEGC